jgi:diguanylate cyclase (GGDEF)-like protein
MNATRSSHPPADTASARSGVRTREERSVERRIDSVVASLEEVPPSDRSPAVDIAFVEREVGDAPLDERQHELHRRIRRRRGRLLDADMMRAMVPTEQVDDDEAARMFRRVIAHRAWMRSDLGRHVPLMVAALDYLVSQGLVSRPVIASEAGLHALVRSSTHDPLTHVLNRREFSRVLSRELASARRYGHPLSLIMFDVDRFKIYNDRHGHPAGDALLRRLAAVMRAEKRATDWCARYGGDEFAIIAAHTTALGAHELAGRVIARCRDELASGVTVSAGIATETGEGESAEQLVAEADAALYYAKRLGGNCVGSAGVGKHGVAAPG